MKRFNMAWLANPENGDAYHGMAIMSDVLHSASQFSTCPFSAKLSERLFKMALSKSDVYPTAHVDYGRFLWTHNRFDESIGVLLNIMEKSPKVKNARSNIAFVYFRQNDFERACGWALAAKSNGDALEPGFLKDMCARAHPDG